MKRAPFSPATLAVLLDQPFARAVDLQTCSVDHHVRRPAVGLGAGQRRGERQGRAAPGECRMAGYADFEAEQSDNGPE